MSLSYEAERELLNRVREAYNPQSPVKVLFSQEDALSITPGLNTLMRHEIQKGRVSDRTGAVMTPFEQIHRTLNIAAATDSGYTAHLTRAGVDLLGLMVDRYYEEHGVGKNTAIPPHEMGVMTGYINFKGVFDRVAEKSNLKKRNFIQRIFGKRR